MDDESPSSYGYVVDFAKNGEEAIALYRDNVYDVVILDLTIPGAWEVKRRWKLVLINPYVKVIVSSGYSSDPYQRLQTVQFQRDVIAKTIQDGGAGGSNRAGNCRRRCHCKPIEGRRDMV